jgi:predicted RNA methylase
MSTDFFKDDGVFLPMLNDVGRNTFYKQALTRAAPGKIVCDIGAGTGFLTVLALQAGAAHVIAVERNVDRFEYLKSNLAKLGYADQVTVIYNEITNCDIKADVYVSETINTQIFGENIVKLSNHVQQHGGTFIPGAVKIWAEVYENHPIFTLDLANSEAVDFSPTIDIDSRFVSNINADFAQQYSLQDTVYCANQLNRLFTMVHRFSDIKLKKLYQGSEIIIDLNQHCVEDNIMLTIPNNFKNNDWAMLVLKWEMSYQDYVLRSNDCWFGNVAKPIRQQFKTQDNIEIRYNSSIGNWQLRY